MAPPSMIMVAPMTVVVVLVVPMSLMALPAFAIVIVVRMYPVGTFKRRTLPTSPDPLVTVTYRCPIALDPYKGCGGRWPRLFINDRRGWCPDVNGDLRRTRGSDSDCEQRSRQPVPSHL